jgi:flagellar basal body-associated protein FliL
MPDQNVPINTDTNQGDINKKKNISTWIILSLSLLFALAPLIYGFFYIHQYGVNVPVDDQWASLVPWTINYFEGAFDPSVLIAEQNDSRGFFPAILMMGISILTGMNTKAIFYAGYLIYVISILGISCALLRDLNATRYKFIVILPILYYALNPYFLFRFIYNVGSLVSLFILFAFATIYALDKSRSPELSGRSSLFFAGSIALGVMCSFSSAPGLTIWFAGLVQIFLQSTGEKTKRILVWIAGAVATFYFYYIGLGFKSEGIHGTSGYSAYITTALTYPGQKLLCFMGAIGAEVVHNDQMAFIFGIMITAILVVLVLNNRDIQTNDICSKWYALLTLGALTAMELAVTRSGFIGSSTFGPPDTIFFVPAIRHSYAIFLPLIALYSLALLNSKASGMEGLPQKNMEKKSLWFGQREINIVLLGMILTLLACGAFLHVLPGISSAEQSYDENIAGQYYLLNYPTATDDQLRVLLPSPSIIRQYAPKMEKYQLGVFSPGQGKTSSFAFGMIDPHSMLDLEGNELSTGSYKKSDTVKIGSLTLPAIFEHPQGSGSSLSYNNIFVPPSSSFDFYTGVDEDTWSENSSDGVIFEINIYDPATDKEENVFSEKADPVNNPADRVWHHHVIDLQKYGGRNVTVRFVTRPGRTSNYDWAWWGDPKFIPKTID